MNSKIVFFCIFFTILNNSVADQFESSLGHIKPISSIEVQKKAVEDLIKRLVPNRTSEFVISIDPEIAPTGRDAFKVISSPDSQVFITGSTGVAAAWGFHHYLKYHCKGHVSWEVQQVNLPKPLSKVNYQIVSNDRFRYYMNVCSYSYSLVWWNWKDWEKHIDWMALNGLNLVLAPVGIEAIWQNVYRKFNLTQEEIDIHFTGPSYISWHRMGNLRTFGGPLSQHWHRRSLILQKVILKRMREFGITPVLQAFNGYVPKSFKRIFPASKMIKSKSWATFEPKYGSSYFVEPTDPIFKLIGKTFLEEQTKEFGTGHVYNCDIYNEITPHSKNKEVLANISKNIYSAMTDVDKQAVWLQQSWTFLYSDSFWTNDLIETYLTAVPLGRMLILDSQAEHFPQYERIESFFGQPFIWTLLNNFGGNNYFYGPAAKINTGVFKARQNPISTMVGTGIAPEGIGSSYPIYDLMSEMSWRTEPVDLEDWFEQYSIRRYGMENNYTKAAWRILPSTIYNYDTSVRYRPTTLLILFPRFSTVPLFFYDTAKFIKAWEYLIKASEDPILKKSDSFRYDVVDFTREALQTFFAVYFMKLRHEYKQKNIENFQKAMVQIQDIFKEMEAILATRKEFLLGAHLEKVKSCANSSEEKRLFEYNARMLLTIWGPKAEILDYGAREWAGMISGYYAPRWEFFMASLNDSLTKNYPNDYFAVKRYIFKDIGMAFSQKNNTFPSKPKGDSILVAQNIFEKYQNLTKTPPKYGQLETDFTKIYERLMKKIFN